MLTLSNWPRSGPGSFWWLPEEEGYPVAEATQFTFDDIKEGLRRLLPVVKTIAMITPNPYDNAFVAFLEVLLKDEAAMKAAVADLKARGSF